MKRGPYKRRSKKRAANDRLATIRQIEADIAMMERVLKNLKNARALHRALLKVYR